MRYKTANGKTYLITTYTVGSAFGTSARVRRGTWSQTIDQTLPFGSGWHHQAAEAAMKLADIHSEVAR